MKTLILIALLVSTSTLHADNKWIIAKYLRGNEAGKGSVIRLYSPISRFTLENPLTVKVIVVDAHGQPLQPRIHPTIISWTSAASVSQWVAPNTVIEIPIGTYKCRSIGTLSKVLADFDLSKVKSISISFPIKLNDHLEKNVVVQLPSEETADAIAGRYSR